MKEHPPTKEGPAQPLQDTPTLAEQGALLHRKDKTFARLHITGDGLGLGEQGRGLVVLCGAASTPQLGNEEGKRERGGQAALSCRLVLAMLQGQKLCEGHGILVQTPQAELCRRHADTPDTSSQSGHVTGVELT